MSAEYRTVAQVGDIPPGQTKLVYVGQCPILLVNEGGEFYALQGLCAHQNLPLAGAEIWQGVLDCPWHHFQYDIRTGENLYPKCVYPLEALPRLRKQILPLQTYPTRIVNHTVQIQIPEHCD